MKPGVADPRVPNAGPDDVARLWGTIQIDFPWVTELRIIPCMMPGQASYVEVQLVSPVDLEEEGSEGYEIWSSREFRSALYLISWNQLFDLLIVGFRAMEARLTARDAVWPNPRTK